MSNLKLNKQVKEEDFNVIPDAPIAEPKANEVKSNDNQTFVKHEEEQGRKLFANKKANIALGILGGVIAVAILAAIIFVYVI